MRTTLLRFLRDTRAGATAIAAVAVTVLTVGASALIVDHVWLVGQRDALKSATDSAAVAATQEMTRRSAQTLTDDALEAALEPLARRYVLLNLSHLAPERYARAKESLTVTLAIDRLQNSVSVTAEADLGGTLFSRHLPLLDRYSGPETMQAKAGTQCGSGLVEVVLALDVTGSMNGKIDKTGGEGPDNHRMQVAIEAAKALIAELDSCDSSDVAVGVIPWDKTVRLPAPDTWKIKGWVDTSNFTHETTQTGHEAWTGCVMDRAHSPTDTKNSAGLSLTLPSDTGSAFPAFMYPDSNRLDPAIFDGMRDKVLRNFGEDAVATTLDSDAVRAAIVSAGDNPWGDTVGDSNELVGGPNFHCTRVAMLPLSTDRVLVEQTLDALYAPDLKNRGLWGGVTMSHLGVTWGRRMLASSWREAWGDETHPVNPGDGSSGEVTKALVLLTDGLNGASSDLTKELPGELTVTFDSTDSALEFGCSPCDSTPRCLARSRSQTGCGPKANVYASRFTAVGRFGTGRAEDGHSVQGRDFTWAATMADARVRLNALLRHSCTLAHEEGLDVYTVALSSDKSLPTAWKNQLIACSGNAGTTTVAERAKYHLLGTDGASLKAAFREIGERLVKLRRTL